ncbi:YqaI family protein [Peribacillus sp. NPDC046944]|uniref:YqaI family protein n=1 Tax=unclassified Peribacillus TaxID=2675266 RepID=UPI003D06EA94
MDHPLVTQIERTGYPYAVGSEEAIGVDYFGNEVWPGDDYFEDPQNGEIVMQENLQDYMSEVYGFEFKTA